MSAGHKTSIARYFVWSALVGAVAAFLSGALLSVSLSISVLVGLAGAVGVWQVVAGGLISRRRRAVVEQLPDVIEMFARSLMAGLSVNDAINQVSAHSDAPLGPEFERISNDLRFGRTTIEAMSSAARRLSVREFDLLVFSLSIQRDTGGNLVETLTNLSSLLRNRRYTKLKVHALAAEARRSACIVSALPFLVLAGIFAFNLEYASTLFVDPRGGLLLSLGLGSVLIGIVVLFRMARFKV